MKHESLPKKNSFYIKYILPLMVVMFILNFTLFAVLFFTSGTRLKSNAREIFGNRVLARKDIVENEMLKNWSNVYFDADKIARSAEESAQSSGKSISEALKDKTAAVDILEGVCVQLFSLLRRNKVNDAFIILDTEFGGEKRYGIYLRDRNPSSQQTDNVDVLIEIAPVAVRDKLYELGLDKSTEYETQFDLSGGAPNNDLFEKPRSVKRDYPTLSLNNSGYWCSDFALHNSDQAHDGALTYSVPLGDANGAFFGVLGVGITLNYFEDNLLPLSDFSDGEANYALVKAESDSEPILGDPIAANFYDLGRSDLADAETHTAKNGELILESDKVKYSVSRAPLNLYAANTPYVGESWALLGIISQNKLYGFTNAFSNLVIILTVAVTIMSIGLFSVFSYFMTSPIAKLTLKIEKQKNGKFTKATFDKTNIYEIDTLVNEIDSLMTNLLEVPQKLTRVLAMTNLPIAAFEYIANRNYFYYTDGFAELLDFDTSGEITPDDFGKHMLSLADRIAEHIDADHVSKTVYDLSENLRPKFVELSGVKTVDGYSGIILDITDDKLARKKLEFERDMDMLTPLMNRKGFERRLSELFGKTEGYSAVLMLDLDRLKFYNDNFGHETGDRVITLVGDTLNNCCGQRCIGCHISGDEFVLYFFDYTDQKELTSEIDAVRNALGDLCLPLDNDKNLRVTVSGGYSICPRDTENYAMLYNYADFALYEAKSDRGSVVEFDAARYASDTEKQKNNRALTNLLDNDLTDFHFQPIIDLTNGETFAYEALIRPFGTDISTPLTLLALAKENGRLPDVEKRTFFGATEKFVARGGDELSAKLFINTISSQMLSDADIVAFEKRYAQLLPRIVLEFTEMEFMNETVFRQRQQLIAKWSAQCALDDYGMGFSNFSMLTQKSLHYVKIDRLLIQDIHVHPHKREIVYSLIKYCHAENIKVIAEGIEKPEELEVMLKFGVDYAQGYFLGYPTKKLASASSQSKRIIEDFQKKS